MNYFRDVSALHEVLGMLYEKAPSEARGAELSRLLEEWGFTPYQASLYASTVLCRNAEGSADWMRTNAGHIVGGWIRGEQLVFTTDGKRSKRHLGSAGLDTISWICS
jgi:hypothetical protein